MVEFEKEQDFTNMAMEVLLLSEEEKKLFKDFVNVLYLEAYASIDYPAIEDIKAIADNKYPDAWPLVEKVLNKTDELETEQSANNK